MTVPSALHCLGCIFFIINFCQRGTPAEPKATISANKYFRKVVENERELIELFQPKQNCKLGKNVSWKLREKTGVTTYGYNTAEAPGV